MNTQKAFGQKVVKEPELTQNEAALIELKLRVAAMFKDHQAATGQRVSFVVMTNAQDGNDSDGFAFSDCSPLDWMKFSTMFEQAREKAIGDVVLDRLLGALFGDH